MWTDIRMVLQTSRAAGGRPMSALKSQRRTRVRGSGAAPCALLAGPSARARTLVVLTRIHAQDLGKGRQRLERIVCRNGDDLVGAPVQERQRRRLPCLAAWRSASGPQGVENGSSLHDTSTSRARIGQFGGLL